MIIPISGSATLNEGQSKREKGDNVQRLVPMPATRQLEYPATSHHGRSSAVKHQGCVIVRLLFSHAIATIILNFWCGDY